MRSNFQKKRYVTPECPPLGVPAQPTDEQNGRENRQKTTTSRIVGHDGATKTSQEQNPPEKATK